MGRQCELLLKQSAVCVWSEGLQLAATCSNLQQRQQQLMQRHLCPAVRPFRSAHSPAGLT